jgi:lipid-A-disaccharide synthase
VVAGEASADAHGAKVIERLTAKLPGTKIFGLGGEKLEAAGLEPVADSAALNVVGISEALRGLKRIKGIFDTVMEQACSRRPGVALLMDLPDFNLRLAKRLHRASIPVVYYIAPQAWAWRRRRVRSLRKWVRRLAVVFPFERQFFEKYRVPVEYVGHPLTEESRPVPEPVANRVAIVPGSRPREIERLLPALAQAARILLQENRDLQFVLPLAPGLDASRVNQILDTANVKVEVISGGASRALAGSRLGLVTSGTATLEAALASVPMVVVYRVSRTTYALVRSMYRLQHACIVNILAGRGLVPELLQGKVRPENIADSARPLLIDGPDREQTIEGLRQVTAELGAGQPSERVAQILGEILRDGQ